MPPGSFPLAAESLPWTAPLHTEFDASCLCGNGFREAPTTCMSSTPQAGSLAGFGACLILWWVVDRSSSVISRQPPKASGAAIRAERRCPPGIPDVIASGDSARETSSVNAEPAKRRRDRTIRRCVHRCRGAPACLGALIIDHFRL